MFLDAFLNCQRVLFCFEESVLKQEKASSIKSLHRQTGAHLKPHLRRQCVVYKNVWSCSVWSEGPNRSGSQQIPVVLGLEKLSQLLPVMRKEQSPVEKRAAPLCNCVTLKILARWGVKGLMEEEEYPMLALLGTNELRHVLTGSLSRAPYTLMHVIMSERGRNSSMLLVNDSITVSDLINIAWRI